MCNQSRTRHDRSTILPFKIVVVIRGLCKRKPRICRVTRLQSEPYGGRFILILLEYKGYYRRDKFLKIPRMEIITLAGIHAVIE